MIWENKLKGNDRIVAFVNNTIYRGNPKEDQISNIIFELKNEKKHISNITGIPISYIKEINSEKGKNYIEILFGKDSSELIKINDEKNRIEIFEFFKNNIQNSNHFVDEYSKYRTGKKPLIGMFVLFALFLLSYYFAMEIENGNYDSIPNKANIIIALVLQVSYLGTNYVMLIFGVLMMIPFLNFLNKTKQKIIVEKIQILR